MGEVIILAASVAAAILFSILAYVFGSFTKKATQECPSLVADEKPPKAWANVCMWLAIGFSCVAVGTGVWMGRKNKSSNISNNFDTDSSQ